MTEISINKQNFPSLKGKVVVITGGATGIGATTISLLHDLGAHVVMGDTNSAAAEALVAPMKNVHFIKTDVTDYKSVHALFQKAYSLHNRIDVAISNAGLVEIGNVFDPDLTEENIAKEPLMLVLDVNLKGTIYFSRLAVFYLRKSKAENPGGENGRLVLVSSAAGFGEYPGLVLYSASKHGVLGLYRSVKNYLQPSNGIKMNVICPDMTDTQMVTGVIALYKAAGIPVNRPEDVAESILHLSSSDVHGQIVYVANGKSYEIGGPYAEAEKYWLGEELGKKRKDGKAALGSGANWTKRKGGSVDDYEKK
ncbi:hypothetical protein RUND412_003182 [Rhizina undulata]